MKKRSGSESSQHSPNFTRHIRQPGKLPPLLALPTSATITNLQSTPNYMKSTTSADARREQANVRRKNPQTTADVTKTLAGMRTLRKRTPSFKPERTLVKTGSPDVLRIQRATCSSTLTGCKSPDYLKLSPGGTESEGTSGVKVCPYSRCSLNGHVHALLPPLKSFISPRRQALKTETSIKLRCQSPKARPTGGSPNCDKLIDRDEAATSNGEEEVPGNLSDGEMCRDIDSRKNLEQIGDLNSTERETAAHVHEKYHEVIIAVDASPRSSAQEAKNEILEQRCVGSMPSVNFHKLDSQSSDMDREKGKHYPTYLVDDYVCTPKMEEESGEQGGKIITCADFIMKSDDRFGRFFDEISVDEESQESFDEESLNSSTLFTSDNCDSVGSYNYLENLCSKKTSALVLVPVQEAAPVGKNDFLFEGNQTPRIRPQNGKTTMCWNAMDGEEHNLKDESLPNEDATTEMGNQAPYLSEEMATLVDSATCKAIKHDQDHVENECNQAENFNGASTKDLTNEPYPGFSRTNSSEAECNVVHEVNPIMEMPETEDKSSIQATVKCEKSNQEADEPMCFNPRELHFLPLEPDPEAEKVNLRHQELDARKNAEEWMVDYALREAVTKIGPARQRKVASLVEAFERVLPTSKS